MKKLNPIGRVRQALKLTQAQFGFLIDAGVSSVWRMEHDQKDPDDKQRELIDLAAKVKGPKADALKGGLRRYNRPDALRILLSVHKNSR